MAVDSERQEAALVSMLIIIAKIPRLFRDITSAVCSTPPCQSRAAELIIQIRRIRVLLQAWRDQNIPDVTATQDPTHCSTYSRPMMLYHVATIYVDRLCTSLHWTSTSDSVIMEQEAQQAARIAHTIIVDAATSSGAEAVLLAARLPMIKATLDTSEEWAQCLQDSDDRRPFILPRATFQRWCDLFGRTTLPGSRAGDV